MYSSPTCEKRRDTEEKLMREWVRRIRSIGVVSVVTGAMALSTANADMVIIYDFADNTAEATTNEFEDQDLGVIAGDIQTSNTHGGHTGIDRERWQRKLLDGSPTTMSFTITIPAGVTIDLTELSFDYGMDSRQGSNDTYGQWELTISQGSASTDSWGPVLLEGTSSNDYWDDHATVTLSGLTELTDTEIEFSFEVNYGVTSDFSGGGNNNNRNAFLDNVTLTGSDAIDAGTLMIIK